MGVKPGIADSGNLDGIEGDAVNGILLVVARMYLAKARRGTEINSTQMLAARVQLQAFLIVVIGNLKALTRSGGIGDGPAFRLAGQVLQQGINLCRLSRQVLKFRQQPLLP